MSNHILDVGAEPEDGEVNSHDNFLHFGPPPQALTPHNSPLSVHIAGPSAPLVPDSTLPVNAPASAVEHDIVGVGWFILSNVQIKRTLTLRCNLGMALRMMRCKLRMTLPMIQLLKLCKCELLMIQEDLKRLYEKLGLNATQTQKHLLFCKDYAEEQVANAGEGLVGYLADGLRAAL